MTVINNGIKDKETDNIKNKRPTLAKSGKIKLVAMLSVVLILAGLTFLVYPYITNIFFEQTQAKLLEEWKEEEITKAVEEFSSQETAIIQKYKAVAQTTEKRTEKDNRASDDTVNIQENYKKEQEPDYSSLTADDFFPLKISIPKIEVDWIVNEGTDTKTLRKGPGHIIETVLPGDDGRCVISGHRTTYGAPFNRINELKAGDIIYLETFKGEIFTYAVRELIVVKPTDVYVLEGDSKKELLLTSCEPKYSNVKRLVVIAELINIFNFENALNLSGGYK